GVQFVFDDVLQIQVDGEMHLIAITLRPLLAAVEHKLLAGPVMLDVAIAVLAAQIIVKRTFHALNAMMLEVGETDDVTEHYAVGVNTGWSLVGINADCNFVSTTSWCMKR